MRVRMAVLEGWNFNVQKRVKSKTILDESHRQVSAEELAFGTPKWFVRDWSMVEDVGLSAGRISGLASSPLTIFGTSASRRLTLSLYINRSCLGYTTPVVVPAKTFRSQ